jgi:hypothetical protein
MEDAVSISSSVGKLYRDIASGHTLHKVSFWIGVASAGTMPLVPLVCQWLYPPVAPKVEPGTEGFLSFALSILGSMGDGIMVMVWVSGLAAVALLASVIAFAAARSTREPRRTKLLCLLPVVMLAVMYGLLVAIGA